MDKVRVLCEMDQFMMRTFSTRTSSALKQHTLFRMLLPAFQTFLDINVTKEEQKDQLVITTAYQATQEKKSLENIAIEPLLQQARKIDQKFLQQAFVFPITININYQDIELIRRQRIELLLDTSYRLFREWEKFPGIRTAIAKLYNQDEFSVWLYKILHLYNKETKNLSHSVRLPGLIGLVGNKLSNTVYSVMEDVAQQLVTDFTQILYRK